MAEGRPNPKLKEQKECRDGRKKGSTKLWRIIAVKDGVNDVLKLKGFWSRHGLGWKLVRGSNYAPPFDPLRHYANSVVPAWIIYIPHGAFKVKVPENFVPGAFVSALILLKFSLREFFLNCCWNYAMCVGC